MKAFQVALSLRVRVMLLATVLCVVAAAGVASVWLYLRPATLTVAVGSSDGEARKAASIVAGRLATTGSSIRLRVENAGDLFDAAKAFANGTADLAVVRADVGDLSQARTVAVMARGVVMIVAPPGSALTSIAKLRGHSVGVVGGEINHGVVDVLKKEYDLGHANVVFKDIAAADARRAIQSKEVSALLLVAPMTEKHLSFVRGLFPESPGLSPVLIPIDAAGAIADVKGPYESYDIPKGTLRGAPAVPDDDVTTLRVAYYLVANRHLNSSLIADLTKKIMGVRRDIAGEQPLLLGIAAPDTDPDAYISAHSGAAAYYNGTQQSFMDRYGNAIYLTPMVLGALVSLCAAAWQFLGLQRAELAQATLDRLCAFPARIRKVDQEVELGAIEDEIDTILRTQLIGSESRKSEGVSEFPAFIAAAQRADNLIRHRRALLDAKAARIAPIA